MILVPASALALVFGIAVAGKLTRSGFGAVRRSTGELWFGPGSLSRRTRHGLAVALVAGELAVLVALVSGTVAALFGAPGWLGAGFAGAAALLAAFTVGHAMAVARGSAARCACFGRTTTTVGPLSLLRTAVLLAVALVGLGLALAGPDRLDPSVVLIAAPIGVVLGLLLMNLEDLVSLMRPSAAPVAPPRRGVRA